MAQAHGEDSGPWALRIAGWFAESRSPGSEHKRRVYLRLAAGQAMREGAWEQAVQLLGQLVDPDLPEARSHGEAQLLQSLGRARAGTGDWPAALANMRGAVTYFKRRGDVRRMVETALIPVFENPGEAGFFDYFDEVLPLLPEDTPQRAHVLWLYGFALFNAMADYRGAEATLRAALGAAQRAGDRITAVRSLDALALLRLRFYRFEEAIASVNEFLPRLARLDDPLILAHSQAVLTWAHKALGQPQVALECAQKALEPARRLGTALFVASSLYQISRFQMDLGDFAAARRTSDEALSARPDNTMVLASRCFLEYTLGNFEAGDGFRRRILGLSRRQAPGPYHVHVHAIATDVVRSCCLADVSALDRHLPPLESIARHPAAHPYISLRARLLMAWIAALIGDPALARRAYRELRDPPEHNLVRPYLVSRVMGLAAHCFGDHRRAAKHLERALEAALRYGDQPLQAWIRYELAQVLLGTSEAGEHGVRAGQLVRDALAQARALGMTPLERRAARSAEKLEAPGDPVGPLDLHLTAREQEVLAAAAEGHGNEAIARRLGISAHTVANHLHCIPGKDGGRESYRGCGDRPQVEKVGVTPWGGTRAHRGPADRGPGPARPLGSDAGSIQARTVGRVDLVTILDI